VAPKLDVIFYTDSLAAGELEEFALRLESLGYETLWVPEFFGRDPYVAASFLLARTTRLRVATGIANVYSHDAIVAAQCRQTLAEQSGGRFVLGLGVSHPPMAEAHGLAWEPPARKMRAYLDTLERMKVESPEPERQAPIWISAHGPMLLSLAAERADAANIYLMPPAHVQAARERVGPDLRLNVVLPTIPSEDAELARRIGRKALSIYMPLPAYQKQWLKWGFEESDFATGGSDRLIDSLVAWGSLDSIRGRMQEYLDAGSTRIALSAMNPSGRGPNWDLYEALA
jgi:probable F420-dependent oxidoreductase